MFPTTKMRILTVFKPTILIGVILFTASASWAHINLSTYTCHSLFEPAKLAHNSIMTEIIKTNGDTPLIPTTALNFANKGFETQRGFIHYLSMFKTEFYNRLNALTADEAILDGGCGDARLADSIFKGDPELIRQHPEFFAPYMPFYQKSVSEKPSYIGTTYKLDKRTLSDFDGWADPAKFDLVFGLFEEKTKAEITKGKKIKLITDMRGILSYSSHLSLVLAKYLDVLDKDGALFFTLPLAIIEKELLTYWLKHIPGIDVKTDGEAVQITIIGNEIKIPEFVLDGQPIPGTPPRTNMKRSGKVYVVNKADGTITLQ